MSGWNSLLDALENREQMVEEDRATWPRSCPNDGHALETGPDGHLFCPFDGWRDPT